MSRKRSPEIDYGDEEYIPGCCSICRFWQVFVDAVARGTCSLTGTEIEVSGIQDVQRMANCPLEDNEYKEMTDISESVY